MKEENNTYSLRKGHTNCSSLSLTGQWTTQQDTQKIIWCRRGFVFA